MVPPQGVLLGPRTLYKKKGPCGWRRRSALQQTAVYPPARSPPRLDLCSLVLSRSRFPSRAVSSPSCSRLRLPCCDCSAFPLCCLVLGPVCVSACSPFSLVPC